MHFIQLDAGFARLAACIREAPADDEVQNCTIYDVFWFVSR